MWFLLVAKVYALAHRLGYVPSDRISRKALKDALIENIDAHVMARLQRDPKFAYWLTGMPSLAVDLAFAVARYTHYIEYKCKQCHNVFKTDVEPIACTYCGLKKKGTLAVVEHEDETKHDHKVNGMVNGLKRGISEVSEATSR